MTNKLFSTFFNPFTYDLFPGRLIEANRSKTLLGLFLVKSYLEENLGFVMDLIMLTTFVSL